MIWFIKYFIWRIQKKSIFWNGILENGSQYVLHCICKKMRIRILKAFISFSKYELTEVLWYKFLSTDKERKGKDMKQKKYEWMQYFHFLTNIACFRFCHGGCACSAILHLYRISQICNFEIDYWNALKTDKNWKFHSLI